VPDAPAAPCAKVESTGVEATGPPDSPGIPARNGFNGLCRALLGDRALLPPSFADMWLVRAWLGRHASRELDASVGAPGPHDFAVRSHRLSSACRMTAHRFLRTRPAIPSHAQRCCVHRIPPRVRDDREPPLMWDETAAGIEVIWGRREQNYFRERDSTDPISASPSGKSHPTKSAAPVGAQPLIDAPIVREYCRTAVDGELPGASHSTQDSILVRRPNWHDRV
jgi:hypothetical protein